MTGGKRATGTFPKAEQGGYSWEITEEGGPLEGAYEREEGTRNSDGAKGIANERG